MEVDFSLPRCHQAEADRFLMLGDVAARVVATFGSFHATIFSAASPPEEWGSTEFFPVDVLLLHHSPRELNNRRASRNWRLWQAGEHEYKIDGDMFKRQWLPPKGFTGCRWTYTHIDLPLRGLQRGDVLHFAGGKIIQFGRFEGDAFVPRSNRADRFGTSNCPWLLPDHLTVYRGWPDHGRDPAVIHQQLAGYLANHQQLQRSTTHGLAC